MLWCRKSFECRESIQMQSTRIPKVNAESLRITRVFAQQESRQSEFVIGSFCFEELVCSWKVSVTSRLSERSPTESLRLSSDHTGVFCPDQLTVCQRRPINMLFWNESFGAFSFGVLIQMLHILHFRWFISGSYQMIHFRWFISNSSFKIHFRCFTSKFEDQTFSGHLWNCDSMVNSNEHLRTCNSLPRTMRNLKEFKQLVAKFGLQNRFWWNKKCFLLQTTDPQTWRKQSVRSKLENANAVDRWSAAAFGRRNDFGCDDKCLSA